MTKILDGRELAGFIKERQAHQVASLKAQGITPKLVIVRDSDDPVITKYVNLKQHYGEDIGVIVEDCPVAPENLEDIVDTLNQDDTVNAFIVQLPIINTEKTEEIVASSMNFRLPLSSNSYFTVYFVSLSVTKLNVSSFSFVVYA